jgi:hypothetical protein
MQSLVEDGTMNCIQAIGRGSESLGSKDLLVLIGRKTNLFVNVPLVMMFSWQVSPVLTCPAVTMIGVEGMKGIPIYLSIICPSSFPT